MPRNYEERRIARKQALAIAKAMGEYDYLCARIRGIDACNYEIGCQLETFAVEFRFLREFVPCHSMAGIWERGPLAPRLSVTCHAGEAF